MGAPGEAAPRARVRALGAATRAPGGIAARLGSASDGLEALGEAAGVRLLGPRQRLEPGGDLLEAFLARHLGEARVHLRVLVRLALDRRLEVLARLAHRHAGDRVADLL